MGNYVGTMPNIPMGDWKPNNSKTNHTQSNFNAKNYLDTRLAPGQKSKTLTIRLLPIDLETGSPWVFIHTHNVRVPKGVSRDGEKPFKTYICLKQTPGIDHDKYGYKCPFCEINKKAWELSQSATEKAEQDLYKGVSVSNIGMDSVICRVIERGKEEDGVKFWKFNIRKDETDPYHQIMKLRDLRAESAARKGREVNILDVLNGRDLNVTFTEGSTSAPTIVDDGESSPLSESEEQMNSWIYDEKKWTDVFTCKPYDYLRLISEMKTPWFDKNQNKWVDKKVFDGEVEEAASNIDAQIEAAIKNYQEAKEFAAAHSSAKSTTLPEMPQESSVNKADDDLPF